MSNFKFLQQEWLSLYSKLKTAEERVFIEPVSCASYCRLVLEESMYLIYDLNHLGITSSSKSNIGLTDNEILQVKAKIIPEGSVIMTCVGDLGVITVNLLKMVVNQQLHAFICGSNLNNIFLMYSLSFQKSYMYKMSSSTTVPYMNKTVCNNTPTIVPSLDLQNQFAERVAVIEEQKAIAQKSLEQSEILFNSLLQKAFKGELV